jgi:sugar lactone lactonase YvrE
VSAAEQVTPAISEHGEGPVWSPSWGGLRWVDMLAGDILQLDDGGGVTRAHVAQVVAALRPRVSGGAVIAVERGFLLQDADGTVHRGTPLWNDPMKVRMNEGGCDPQGRFYCGSMAYDARPGAGALYRFDPDGSVTVVLPDVTVSNGLEWSPTGELAYYVDSATRRVDVFDHDAERGLTGRRPFVHIEEGAGDPDGLTVDSEGGVWVALFGGGEARRYDANGTLTEVVSVPAAQVTACTFGGDALHRLYITTSRHGLAHPSAADGALFVREPGVGGRPVREFAG